MQADQVSNTAQSRRGGLQVLLKGGTAFALAHLTPALAVGTDPLLGLEQKYLALGELWLALARAEDEERAQGASTARRKELECATMTAVGDANAVADEIAATVPVTIDGLAVQLRRLLEIAYINAEDVGVEHARRALDCIATMTGRPQLGPLRLGIEAELARKAAHA